jgi:DNA-binding CsgD family transcriptional regulator
VHEGLWLPQWVSDPRDPSWGEQILEAARAEPRPLDGRLVESDLGTDRPVILVRGAQRHPRVHDRLARASLVESYVAVALIADGRVIGLLHADCHYQRREPDELARKLLGVFAQVLTQAILRSTTTDHLAHIESELTRLSGSLPGRGPDTSHGISLRAHAHAAGDHIQRLRSASPASRYRLTKRQVEVLELVAEGHTNAVIGTRLYITQDTVKSHVKMLLRKFGAANRAELVSRWLNVVNQ